MAMTISGSNGVTYPDGTVQASGSQACKAWVNFNGTGTVAIRAAYNVTSITDNATGNYTVNLTTAMPDANGAATVDASFGTPFGDQVDFKEAFIASAATIQVGTYNGTNWQDAQNVYVALFR